MSIEWVYIGFYQWNHRLTRSVGDSADECVVSLYGDSGLNPSVISSVKSSKQSMSLYYCNFPKNYIICQWYGRYIPTDYFHRYIPIVSPTDILYRYITTELETKVFLSIKITDEKIMLVIMLAFADFLVVNIITLSSWAFLLQFTFFFISMYCCVVISPM